MGTTVETKTLFTLKTTILRLRSSRALASTQYQRNVETCRRLHSSRRYAFLIWRLIFYTFDGLPTIFRCITTKTLKRALYIRERICRLRDDLNFCGSFLLLLLSVFSLQRISYIHRGRNTL